MVENKTNQRNERIKEKKRKKERKGNSTCFDDAIHFLFVPNVFLSMSLLFLSLFSWESTVAKTSASTQQMASPSLLV